jgi:hypothetical protein
VQKPGARHLGTMPRSESRARAPVSIDPTREPLDVSRFQIAIRPITSTTSLNVGSELLPYCQRLRDGQRECVGSLASSAIWEPLRVCMNPHPELIAAHAWIQGLLQYATPLTSPCNSPHLDSRAHHALANVLDHHRSVSTSLRVCRERQVSAAGGGPAQESVDTSW